MPRSLREMIDDGDEELEDWCEALADWCEAYGPSPENEKPVSEFFLSCVADHACMDEAETADYVSLALARGVSWSRVAEALGMSVVGTQNRFPGAELAALKASEEYVASLALVVSAALDELWVSVALAALAEFAASPAPAASAALAALAEFAASPAPVASAASAALAELAASPAPVASAASPAPAALAASPAPAALAPEATSAPGVSG